MHNNILGNYNTSVEALNSCLLTRWVAISDKNMALCTFSRGKAHQSLIKHSQALEDFNLVIKLQPNNPHAYFRRAWSLKALGDLDQAASDFEYAKQLNPSDPNFFVSYRKVHKFEFIQIDSEPDLHEDFPILA